MVTIGRLCSTCKTGKEAFELDNKAACPYIHKNNGRKCPNYVKLNNKKKFLTSFKLALGKLKERV